MLVSGGSSSAAAVPCTWDDHEAGVMQRLEPISKHFKLTKPEQQFLVKLPGLAQEAGKSGKGGNKKDHRKAASGSSSSSSAAAEAPRQSDEDLRASFLALENCVIARVATQGFDKM